jgi:predicted dehydrogenase
MAELFVEALQTLPGAKIQAVAARSEGSASRFAARFGVPNAVAGTDALMERTDVDVVYIATPNEQHAEHCLKAIEAGKAVLCEKPFALTAAEARQVAARAGCKKIFCMEAMWMRFAPAVREALVLAREGRLGRLEFFSGQLGFPYSPDPESRLFRRPGGGALLDLGVYPLSLAQALFGSPVRVISTAELSASGVDEQFAAVLSYQDGVEAVIAASLRTKLANSASIHGGNAVLNLEEPLYFPEGYGLLATPSHSVKPQTGRRLAKLRRLPLLRQMADWRIRSRVRKVQKGTSQSGYCFEAAEVQRCLQAGLLESPEMPVSDTLSVLESMDSIRSHW